MTDNNHHHFADLRTGGNLPRKRPGLIRTFIADAIGAVCIIALPFMLLIVAHGFQ